MPPPPVLDESSLLQEDAQPSPVLDGALQERTAPRPRVRGLLTQGRPRKKTTDSSSSPSAPPLETFGITPAEPAPAQATPEQDLLQPGMTPMLRRAGAPSELALDVDATPVLDAGDTSPIRKKKRKLLASGPNFLRINEVRWMLTQASATLSPGHELMIDLSPAKMP